jgi:DNA-packaging protein gp3
MAAPPNNQFWKLRSKHGRDKLFATPDLLLEAAYEYFEYVTDNPEYESKPMVTSNGSNEGSSIEMAKIPVKQPFTLHGLCLFLDCSTSYFRAFKSTIKPEDKDFLTVIEKIEEIIYNQKFSGAASGFFNANIIARDLGLKEQTDLTTGGEKISPVITAMVDGQIIDGEMK